MRYRVGQIIHHRGNDYRGVVVAADRQCMATDDWYCRSQVNSDRNQPWYHVLVDGGYETYVAEESLEPDSSRAPVAHPYIDRVFPTFRNGRYFRDSLN